MRFLIFLLAIASLVGLGMQRTPKVPPIPDYAKAKTAEVEPTMPSVSVFQLGADLQKTPETMEWMRSVVWMGSGCESPIGFQSDQVRMEATLELAESAKESGVASMPISGNPEFSRSWAKAYEDVAYVFATEFLIRARKGDVAKANAAIESLASLNQQLSEAKWTDAKTLSAAARADAISVRLARCVASDLKYVAKYGEKMKTALKSDFGKSALYERTLRNEAEWQSDSMSEGLSKSESKIARYYDSEYARRYLFEIARLSSAGTTMEEVKTFYDSLPFCPMEGVGLPEGKISRGELMRKIHAKFVCPYDPLRGEFATRFALIHSSLPAIAADGDFIELIENEKSDFYSGKSATGSVKPGKRKVIRKN